MTKFTKEFGLSKIRGAPVKKHPVGEGIITFKREMVYDYMNGFYLLKNSDKQYVRGLDMEVDEPSFFTAT